MYHIAKELMGQDQRSEELEHLLLITTWATALSYAKALRDWKQYILGTMWPKTAWVLKWAKAAEPRGAKHPHSRKVDAAAAAGACKQEEPAMMGDTWLQDEVQQEAQRKAAEAVPDLTQRQSEAPAHTPAAGSQAAHVRRPPTLCCEAPITQVMPPYGAVNAAHPQQPHFSPTAAQKQPHRTANSLASKSGAVADAGGSRTRVGPGVIALPATGRSQAGPEDGSSSSSSSSSSHNVAAKERARGLRQMAKTDSAKEDPWEEASGVDSALQLEQRQQEGTHEMDLGAQAPTLDTFLQMYK
ncbi:hypothetical protein DUNSADRAFT_844 [Dunaliella salina]|uniref:Uncharacterized protein n=1 Tax=Dunaliella salina TaxID=3046 RepID=A0ABQ7FYA4_DUNSA|nr:hypothetical protein DUNSADRAFT_844 [Dunaliella salina]|eukprot:KAF5827335.1 hypothetical protein DUNSADRAFT_844 [Dunaliella salina]